MQETLREIYNNIHNSILNSVNSYIGQKFDKNLLAYLENQIIYNIKYQYPQFNFKFSIDWDEYKKQISPKFELSSQYFPMMKTENYLSHDFTEDYHDLINTYRGSQYVQNILRCQKCNIKITEGGCPIDEDLNCNEMIIKNIIE